MTMLNMIPKNLLGVRETGNIGNRVTKAPETQAVSQLFKQFDNVVNHASTPLQ